MIVDLDVGGVELPIGLLDKHAALLKYKPCPQVYVDLEGNTHKCRKTSSPHYCEPRVALILDFWAGLRLVRPPYVDERFELLHWNLEKIKQLFGVVVADEHWDNKLGMPYVRNYQKLYVVGTRGGLKTTFMSGVGCLFVAKSPPGTEMVICAQTEDRAEQTLGGSIRDMIELSPGLDEKAIRYVKSKMLFRREGTPITEARIMSARSQNVSLGQRLSLILIDEFAAIMGLREFISDATYSWGFMPEPLMIMSSTVAEDYASYEAEQTETMRDVLEYPDKQPRTIPVLNIADEGEDWRDKDIWRKVNFHIGLGLLDEAALESEYLRALGNPIEESIFARFRVGVRVSSHTSYIPMSLWDRNHINDKTKEFVKPALATPEDIEQEMQLWPVFFGVDFSEVSDWTSCVAMCLTDRYLMLLRQRTWIPKSSIPDMNKRLGGRVSEWIDNGYLFEMEDGDIGIRRVAEEIGHWAGMFPDLRAIGFNGHKAMEAQTIWETMGIYCTSVRQGHKIQEGAMDIFYAAKADRLAHGGDPVLRFGFECAELKEIADESRQIVKPKRGQSSKRVDPAVSSATAVMMRKLHFQYAPAAQVGGGGDDEWVDLSEAGEDDWV